MKLHSADFKEIMKQPREATRELTKNGVALNLDLIKGLKYNANVDFLKSLMKNLEITTSETLQKNDVINFKYTVNVNGTNESLNYGNFVVYEIEEQEDTGDFKITCYDKMLYSMTPYEGIDKEFPLTVRDYIGGICEKIGLSFASADTTFTNYDKIINEDLYNGLGYTYRDVLDEFSQATASMICINENDEVEVRSIVETNDVIDEDFMNDTNITLKEKYGDINSVVLSRSADADNIVLKDDDSVATNGLCELKIVNNQIMNFNDRDTYLQEIFNKLNGLYFYLNDFESKGICYYDIFDKYTIRLKGVDYPCLMLNDEIDFGVGTHETIYTERPSNTTTNYTKTDSTDKRLREVYIIANKQEGTINAVVNEQSNQSAKLSQLEINSGMISEQVSSMQTTVDETSGQVTELEQTVRQNITSTSTQFETINKTLTDGVEKVVNDLVTIDNRGVVVSTSEDEFEAILSNKSVEIADGLKEIAFFGYDEELQKTIARIEELETRKLTSGNHRCEPFRDEETFENRSGWFYVGGVR